MTKATYEVGRQVKLTTDDGQVNGTLTYLNSTNDYFEVNCKRINVQNIRGGKIESVKDDLRLAVQSA